MSSSLRAAVAWLVARWRWWVFTVVLVAVIVVPVWPGRLNFDTDRQIGDARSGDLNDMFAPLLTLLWRPFVRAGVGSGLILVVQTAVIVLAVAAIARSFGHSRRLSAALTAAVCLSPWVLAAEMSVTRDTWFLAFVLASVAVAVHPTLPTRPRIVLLLLGAFLIQAARQNGIFLIVPMLAWPAWQLLGRREMRRSALRGLAAFGLGAAAAVGVVAVYQATARVVGVESKGPEAVIYIVDLDEMSTRVGAVLVPKSVSSKPLTLDYLRESNIYSMDRLFYIDRVVKLRQPPGAREDVAAAWRRAVLDHPVDYLRVRWKLFTRQIGWSGPGAIAYLPNRGASLLVKAPRFPEASDTVSNYLDVFTDGGRWWVPGWTHRAWIWLSVGAAVAALRRRWQHWYLIAMATAHAAGLFFVATSVQYRFLEPAVVLCVVSLAMSLPYAMAAIGRWGSALRRRQIAGYDRYSNESST